MLFYLFSLGFSIQIQIKFQIQTVGFMLRRRRSSREKRLSAEAVCMRWPKVPLHEASTLQTDLKIE
jgi:hypothetical protein